MLARHRRRRRHVLIPKITASTESMHVHAGRTGPYHDWRYFVLNTPRGPRPLDLAVVRLQGGASNVFVVGVAYVWKKGKEGFGLSGCRNK